MPPRMAVRLTFDSFTRPRESLLLRDAWRCGSLMENADGWSIGLISRQVSVPIGIPRPTAEGRTIQRADCETTGSPRGLATPTHELDLGRIPMSKQKRRGGCGGVVGQPEAFDRTLDLEVWDNQGLISVCRKIE
jgi:hypothetical protein